MSFRDDINVALKQNNLTRLELSKITNISYVPLCNYISNRKTKGTSIAERLIPYIYGEKQNELSKHISSEDSSQ